MQYILTEKEFRALKKYRNLPDIETLQKVCTEIADTFPITFWGRTEPIPWGCILTAEEEWVCDECPVEKICPFEYKEFSK